MRDIYQLKFEKENIADKKSLTRVNLIQIYN